jgi:SAM-dependent methyltransferase
MLPGGYDPSFFADLATAEDRHFWFRARNRLIIELSRRICSPQQPVQMVLEVGCGTGNVLRALVKGCPHATVIGMELWFEGLRFAQKRTEAHLVQGDIRQCPLGRAFHLVGLFDVLEHLPREKEALQAIRMLLASDGRLMLTVPAHQALWSYFDEAAMHCRRYSPGEICERLREAGFEVEFVSQFMACIFPIVWWVRRARGARHRPRDPQSFRIMAAKEFRIVPIVNKILNWLLALEALWIGSGHHLPIGTSLVVIARKA